MYITYIQLFQTTKIQIFESNSQPPGQDHQRDRGCFRLQRYKFLKAIHNTISSMAPSAALFQTTKIQIFESNSQLWPRLARMRHVVSDYKDTNF